MSKRNHRTRKQAKRLRVVVPPNDATPEELAKALLRPKVAPPPVPPPPRE